MHLVGFIIRIYHDAHSSECEIQRSSSLYCGSQNCPKDWNNVTQQIKCKNILFVNFNCQGLLHYKYVPRCQLVNKDFHLVFFWDVWERNDQNFDRNAAGSSPWQCTCGAYSGLSVQIFLKKKKTIVVSQSHYNPVLSLAEYFLFPKLIVWQEISLNQ